MQKGKIIFVGNFWEYFGLSIALLSTAERICTGAAA